MQIFSLHALETCTTQKEKQEIWPAVPWESGLFYAWSNDTMNHQTKSSAIRINKATHVSDMDWYVLSQPTKFY